MTAVAVVRDGLLRLPMAVETRRMACRDRLESRSARRMADGAVVVLLGRMSKPQQGNHVLMPIVRELDCELERGRRITECKSRFIARRRFRMANGADCRPCTAEKLRPVTAHTGVVAGIIFNIRKSYFVAGVASGLVFLCGVGELRIISHG